MTTATIARPPRSNANATANLPPSDPIAVLVRPIRSDADLVQAQRRIESLWGAAPGTPAGDELDVLSDLVAAYEAQHHPIPEADPLTVLRSLMEANGLTQRDLPEVGNQSVVSQVLSGKRRLNLRQVQSLAQRFAVPPTVFLAPADSAR